jgi:hypothetical protein
LATPESTADLYDPLSILKLIGRKPAAGRRQDRALLLHVRPLLLLNEDHRGVGKCVSEQGIAKTNGAGKLVLQKRVKKN